MTVARRSWEDPDDYWYYCVETAGVAFFFALVGMMETMAPRGRGAVRPSTHPPAAERQARNEVTYGRISRYPPNPFALELPIVLAALWDREGERVSAAAAAAAERDG